MASIQAMAPAKVGEKLVGGLPRFSGGEILDRFLHGGDYVVVVQRMRFTPQDEHIFRADLGTPPKLLSDELMKSGQIAGRVDSHWKPPEERRLLSIIPAAARKRAPVQP
jgi:hypothetical protein